MEDRWAIPDCIPVSVEVIDSTCIEWLKHIYLRI